MGYLSFFIILLYAENWKLPQPILSLSFSISDISVRLLNYHGGPPDLMERTFSGSQRSGENLSEEWSENGTFKNHHAIYIYIYIYQSCQLSRFRRVTHAFACFHTLSRHTSNFSRQKKIRFWSETRSFLFELIAPGNTLKNDFKRY